MSLRTISPTDMPSPARSESFVQQIPVIEEEEVEIRPKKRVRFTETIKVQDYEMCPYDIPFHQQPKVRVVVNLFEADDDSIPREPPASPDERELLVENTLPELVVPMKKYDGQLNIQSATISLVRLAVTLTSTGLTTVICVMRLSDLDTESVAEKLRTCHSKLVDIETALKNGESVLYAGPRTSPINPDRLEPLQTVLRQLRTLCENRGVVLKLE